MVTLHTGSIHVLMDTIRCNNEFCSESVPEIKLLSEYSNDKPSWFKGYLHSLVNEKHLTDAGKKGQQRMKGTISKPR